MKVLERLDLIDRVARELQTRMSYREIDTYLKAHGVKMNKPTSGVNSKWIYSKEILSDEPIDLILRIADELKLTHGYTITEPGRVVEATFWEPFHFKLFLSHISAFRKTT